MNRKIYFKNNNNNTLLVAFHPKNQEVDRVQPPRFP